MKKFKFGSRVLALVLTFVMVLSLVPASVLAATKGDIVTSTNKGTTGIDEGTLNNDGTINWPIKVYDYLADGMLFEFAQNGSDSPLYTSPHGAVDSQMHGGQYVLGQPMPYGNAYVTDYTSDAAYSSNAYVYRWDTKGYGKSFYRERVSSVNYSSPQHLRLTPNASATSSGRNFYVADFYKDFSGTTLSYTDARYMVMVYRSKGLHETKQTYDYWGGTVSNAPMSVLLTNDDSSNWRRYSLSTWKNSTEWTYVVMDLYSMGCTSSYTRNVGITPYFNKSVSGAYLDLSHVGFFSSSTAANTFGQQCVTFNNEPGEYIYSLGDKWNPANNTAFGMLFATNGAAWSTGGGAYDTSVAGSASTGYYTHQIGYRIPEYSSSAATYNANRKTGKDATTGRFNGTGSEQGENGIYYITSDYCSSDQYQAEHPNATSFDMSSLDFGGYSLLTQATKGLWTAGLLDNTLAADGTPVYKQETVEYIADLLSKTLTIPQYAGSNSSIGYPNYNFVAGVKNREQFGYSIVDGKEVANDLAQGLRNCLGITFTSGDAKGSTPTMGTYADTIAKADKLKGAFMTVANGGYIKTCMDAAYYLLHNLFVSNSYNQEQDDFRYLTLSSATLDNGTDAFVFDGGFSNGASLQDLIDGKITQTEYKAATQNAVEYNGYNSGGDGTISLNTVSEKDLFYYANAEYARTTRYPFLPVVDSEGVYAGQTDSYYFAEDGKRSFDTEYSTYYGRNYNYVLASNGEFVFTEEDDLFFEFEGDDDVYLFINGELVLDIGGGHSISNCSFHVNDYVVWARDVLRNPAAHTEEEIARAEALDLENGEIASFDFYYMERHGYGANMRIVTNMHITDPQLRIEKTAYQGGKQIEYGGIVDADDPIEYNFKLNNIGNTKLYNLTFNDEAIGVSLTPDNGLLVAGDDTETELDNINGYLVTDARGERLDAQDLTAIITGYKQVSTGGNYIQNGHTYTKVEDGAGTHIYYDALTVNFANNEELKNFLKNLQSDVTDSETVDEELTQQGLGLWVDSSVTFKGIYYTMTDDQETAGMFENTVYVTATTKSDPEDAGSETLRSEARHRVYVTAIPSYYQWAEHDLFVTEQQILDDATAEAGNEGSMLHDYEKFFDTVNKDLSKITVSFADRMGNKLTDADYEFVDSYSDASGKSGFKTNYDTPGIYEFYLLMYLKTASGNIDTMDLGEYAIVRTLIIVADVEDSQYVLDYGLTTENLDKNGELFKNDELYGSMSGTMAKLMGFSTTKPSYLNVLDGGTDYNRIDFSTYKEGSKIYTEDGYYTANMAIPEEGKDIKFDEFSGMYTLTDTGTTLIHADVPYAWENLNLYYWYDDGRDNVWPGTPMTMTSHGNFELAIPSNVPHIIISNGTNQTVDIDLNPGYEAWVDIDGTLNANEKLTASITYKTADGILHAAVPEDWGDVYIYCWDAFGNGLEQWPGTKIEAADADGYYTYTLPGDITNVIVNNGDKGKQTSDLVVYAGEETWITVNNTPNSTNEELGIEYYNAISSRSTETVTYHATVPEDWKGAAIWYWNSNGMNTGLTWPGVVMTKGEDGVYYAEGIPADVENVLINDAATDGKQTENLTVTPGLETWITVNDIHNSTNVLAYVDKESWGDVYFYFFNNSGGTVGTAWPGTKVEEFLAGTYSMSVPDGATKLIVNNNAGQQTQDILLTANKTNQFNVANYNASAANNTQLTITVPESWTNVNVYCWNDSIGNNGWPGEAATKNDDGTYSFTMAAGYNKFIINNGSAQTSDILNDAFYMGGNNLITVYDDNGYTLSSDSAIQTLYTANTVYGENADAEGFTFTPTNFMDSMYNLWMAITVHETDINTAAKPTALGSAINIGKEVQMFKKITVLPASVVYYEDDFAGINYNYNTGNVITHYGNGSGSLGQSVDQSQQYGQDNAYQGSENDEITGSSLTDVYINNTNTFASFTFTGTGFEIIGHNHAESSGTLMVSLYDAEGNFIKKVPVITEFDNGGDGGTETIVSVPVVRISGLEFGTYKVELSGVPIFDFSNWTDMTQAPPVTTSYLCIDGIRVYQPIKGTSTIVERQNLALNKTYKGADVAEAGSLSGYYYTANLTDGKATDYIDSTFATGREGWFGYHRTLNVKTTSDNKPYGELIVDLEDKYSLDEFRIHFANYSLGAPGWVDLYVSTNGTDWVYAGSPSNINYSMPADPYWAELKLDTPVEGRYVRADIGFYSDTNYWVMLNEIEVYGSKTVTGEGIHDAYIDTENGATFTEVRDLISDRQAFAVNYDDTDGLTVSGGTNTWIENRNNVLPSDHNTTWTNNTVNSVNDYLLAGPNNEVYMIESTDKEKSAIAFYVTEKDTDVHDMQIAVRALDYGSYIGSQNTGQLHAEIQYGAMVDGALVWKTLTTTVSSAEQYFTIPYTECPYDETLDRYQVVLRVADTTPTGMASYTTLKYNGLELLTLNETEVPDIIYGDELGNTLLDSNGNTLESSKFVDFIDLVDQMTTDTEVGTGDTGSSDTTEPEEETITGASTSAMGVLYDTFTANTADFAITDTSKIYVVTDSEDNAPAQDVLDTAQLVQRQFAADGYDMDVVWGLEKYATKGDIIVYVGSSYDYGDEGFKIEVTDRAKTYAKNSDAMLYALNTLQKHFRAAGTNAIKGFTLTDAPDTKERTVHLDIARKYLTKDFIKNFIAEMSWMGYNSIELHFNEDAGFRSDFWDSNYFTSPTGNDFSWIVGSEPQYWNYYVQNGHPDVDDDKYLTTAELIEICETAVEYHIDIIPSFDTPAHVGWLTSNYYNNYQGKTFNYEGTTYTLPNKINYGTGVTNGNLSVLNLGNDTVRKFSYALHTDIAEFFRQYAGSTKFNICGDEVGLSSTSTDGWNYSHFVTYANDLNALLKEHGYTVRMYNDFAERTDYKNKAINEGYTVPALASDIEIVFWSDDNTNYKTASSWISDGRTMYNGLNYWTYYALRIFDTPGYESRAPWGKDARDPSNNWWSFYRNQEDLSYAEWNPTRFNGYNNSTALNLTNSQLGGGYFMIWCDYMSLNTEVEMWNGVWDSTSSASKGKYFYSLIDRMWSNAEKQWNWDINSTLSFTNYETLRDKQGYFPGYVATSSTQSYANAMNLPEEKEIESAYRTYHTVTFKNYDGTVLGTQEVKEGYSATYTGETPTRPADVYYTYTFSGWNAELTNITTDMTVVAQYSTTATVAGTTGYLELKSSGGSNINMSIDGGTSRPVGTEYINSSMGFGKYVTVKAVTNNDNKFMGWVNAKTGEVVSNNSTYSFYTSGNDVLVAMYAVEAEGKSLVTFRNDKTNQIIEIQYYSAYDIIAFPAVADYPGYKFAGWDRTDAEIAEKLSKGESITITTKWNVKNVYFKVVVNGGIITSSGGGGVDGNLAAYKKTTIVANDAESGKKFAYWMDEQGRIVSYYDEYSFYPHKNTELTAVYVAESDTVDYKVISTVDIDSTTLGDANTVFYSWDASAAGFTVVNTGVLLVKKEHYLTSTFGVGTIDTNVIQYVTPAGSVTDGCYSVTVPSVQFGDTWVAKSFVQYRDANGVLRVVYSDLCQDTKVEA